MSKYRDMLQAIVQDPRYLSRLDWGEPRPNHPEGTIRAHIADCENNLAKLTVQCKLPREQYDKLLVLIHVHDTFKPDAKFGVAITDPRSHASLARNFLAEFCDDADMLTMVQYHDEPFALWRQVRAKGTYNSGRLVALIQNIKDWDTFVAFNIIDGCTEGKEPEPLKWFLKQIDGHVEHRFTDGDILA